MKLSSLRRDMVTGHLDPVCHDTETGLFYFYEENWAHLQGPFVSEAEANKMLNKYCVEVLGDEPQELLPGSIRTTQER